MNDHGRATHRAFLNGPLGTVSALDDVLRDLDRLIATRFKDQLDPRAKSTLCDREIHFPPYDANGLQTILRGRAEDAFHDGGLDGDVIPLAAAFAAQRSGYARTALDLLYEAADIASTGDVETVSEEHLRTAEDRI